MISILSPTAFRIFSKGAIAVFICSAVMKRPWFSIAAGSNGQIFMAEMPLSRRLSATASARIMKPSRSSIGPAGLAQAPVRYRLDVGGADIPVPGAGIVDAKLVPAETAEHLVHRLIAHLAEDVPERDVDGRSGAVFGAGRRLRHREIDHVAVDGLDMQRIAPEKARRERLVDMRLGRAGAVERFAETDDPAVGVNADPEDVGIFLCSQGLDECDLHGLCSLRARATAFMG